MENFENGEEKFESEYAEDELVEIHTEAIERLKLSQDAFQQIHQEYKEDIKFGLLGDQWDGKMIQLRTRAKRTVATFNKMVPMIRYVVNNNMKAAPSICVKPKSQGKKESADVIEGLVRYIENESNSRDVRVQTLQDAVAGGIGVWEIVIDEESGEPRERRITDPTSVYPDPNALDPTFTDMKWLFHIKSLTKKEYEEKYGEITSSLQTNKEWYRNDNVTICEYWVKKDGKVCWYIIDGEKILDMSDKYDESGNLVEYYPGKFIPYCFITGEDIQVDDKRVLKSIIRDVKDYQKTLNYMQSEAIDYVAKNSKAPYTISDKNIKAYKEIYDEMETKQFPYMPYVDGSTPPQRTPPPPAPIGYLEEIGRLDTDIRTTIGIRDPLQDIPSGQSGKAIKLQIAEGNIGTYAWYDHLNRAIKQSGKILVDLIPSYFNYEHIQHIIGIDGNIQEKNIMLPDENGNILDLSGEYLVTISTGPSYEDARSESYEKLLELFKINPMLAQVGSDIMVRNMDFKESDKLADRIFTMLDPKIVKNESEKGNSEINTKIQMQMLEQKFTESQKVIEQLTQVLNQKNAENEKLKNNTEMDMVKAQQKLASDQLIQNSKNEAELQKTLIQTSSDERIAEMEKQLKYMQALLEANIPQVKNITVENNTTHISHNPVTPNLPII